MKNKHLKIIGLFLVLAWSSCEKVEIPDSSYTGIPFGISGKAGNEDLKLGIDQAGIKLVTGAEYVEDAVWEFSGRLESSGTDKQFLSIQLRNRNEGNNPVIEWQSFLSDSLGFMQEDGVTRTVHPLKIRIENDEDLEIRNIQVGDQRREILQQEAIFFMPNRVKIPVCVDYGRDTLHGRFCTEINHQAPIQAVFPNWVVMFNVPPVARLGASLRNGQAQSFNWGNGNQNSEHLSVDATGTYEIKMTDNQGRKFSHSKQLLHNNSAGFYTYGNSFTFNSEWLPAEVLNDKKQLRSVNITYRDRSGVIYRSNRGPQSVSRFIIEEIQEYEKDGRGRPTLAIKVRFNARLFSTSGESILLENCHGWFAVGLP